MDILDIFCRNYNKYSANWERCFCYFAIVNNSALGLIWVSDSMYLFDSHSKDENNNLSSSGTVLPKFDTLHSLENYIRSAYYNNFH